MHTANLLVVEDEPRVAQTICSMLERAGHRVRHVDSASGIATALTDESFDAVISDINLPDDTNLRFLDELVGPHGPTIPVIVITGAPSVETAVRALRYGVVDYLQKPFDRDALLASVDKALQWQAALQAVEQAQRDAESWLRSLRSTSRLLQFGPTPSPQSGDSEADDILIQKLSQRERDIVKHLSGGRRVAEIAEDLHISPNTVRNHLKSIFRKLGVSSQVELLARLSGSA